MFRTKDGQRDEPIPVAVSSSNAKTNRPGATQVATGARFKGELTTPGSLLVEGRIEGTISAEGDIQIGAQGLVEAQIDGKNITVAGRVKGRIYADGSVVLLSGSHVEGDIHAQSLKIEDAVFFQGGCVMGEESRKLHQANRSPLPASVQDGQTQKKAA
ncbi:MAG: polymer-forming cytoskeletal protein [Candidatus Eisenbacteria bacterium]